MYMCLSNTVIDIYSNTGFTLRTSALKRCKGRGT